MKKSRKFKIITSIIAAVLIVGIGAKLYIDSLPKLEIKEDIVLSPNDAFDLTNYIESIKGYTEEDIECDASQVDTTKLGAYEVKYQVKGKEYTTTVEVKDTTSPKLTTQDVTKVYDSTLKPEDFIKETEDFSKVTYQFKEEYDFSEVGDQNVTIIATDESGNTAEADAIAHVVKDTTAPTLKGNNTLSVYVNSKVNFNKGISVKDDYDAHPTFTCDSSKVDLNTVGTYTATYTTKDCYNNTKDYTRKIVVKELKPTKVIPQSSDKVVYLTFDDGPSARTKEVVDILNKYGVHGTFFVTGNGQKYNSYIKYAYDHGNTIALHTYTHDYAKVYKSVDAYFEDLDKVGSMVEGIIGFRPHYIRFPGGSSNTVSRKYTKGIMSTLVSEVQSRGYQYYDWNASSGDATGTTVATSKIIKSATSYSGNNIMLLMHDCSSKTTTVEALPVIIEYYANKGYTFKAIDDSSFTPHHHVAN